MRNITILTATGTEAVAEDDEARLIAEAQRDPRAFGVFYERYATQAFRYLRARTASDDEAADLTQQVFLKALDALPRYRQGQTPFAGWLFRIARNSLTDAHRRRRVTVRWDLVPEVLHPVEKTSTEEIVVRQEDLHSLQQLLLRLELEKRELIILRFFAGLSTREIAAVVGKSESAVQKQLTRTLHRLQENYDAHQ